MLVLEIIRLCGIGVKVECTLGLRLLYALVIYVRCTPEKNNKMVTFIIATKASRNRNQSNSLIFSNIQLTSRTEHRSTEKLTNATI